jgi:CheY-like chemotaxis protein
MMSSPYALVLDDDELLRTRVRDALAGDGWDVRCSARSPAASLLVASRQPDVVLLDVSEPSPAGRALAADLRIRYGPALPIVAVSSEPLTPLLDQVHPYTFVTKPPNVPRLVAMIEHAQRLSARSALLRTRSSELLEKTRRLRIVAAPRLF